MRFAVRVFLEIACFSILLLSRHSFSEPQSPSCGMCPKEAPLCEKGVCVSCTSDDHCSPGLTCNSHLGFVCVPYARCEEDSDCDSGKICQINPYEAEEKICSTPFPTCSNLIPCPENFLCQSQMSLCSRKKMPCEDDKGCPRFQYCDRELKVCQTDLDLEARGSCQSTSWNTSSFNQTSVHSHQKGRDSFFLVLALSVFSFWLIGRLFFRRMKWKT